MRIVVSVVSVLALAVSAGAAVLHEPPDGRILHAGQAQQWSYPGEPHYVDQMDYRAV